jgi:hypothetical protein
VSISEVSASSILSWPQFWAGISVILVICVSGIVAITAVIRARPEDVPKVFAIFSSAFTQVAGRFRYTAQTPHPPGLEEAGSPVGISGHDGGTP